MFLEKTARWVKISFGFFSVINLELSLGLKQKEKAVPGGNSSNNAAANKVTIEKKVDWAVPDEMVLPFMPPRIKPFNDSELLFWSQYGVSESLLESYAVHSIKEFYGWKTNNDVTPQQYTIRSSHQKPVFRVYVQGLCKGLYALCR